MSPTVFYHKNYRFFFFSREELRRHVHIRSPNGEAKIWLEPEISIAISHGFSAHEINELKRIVEDNADEIRQHWDRHFKT
jgi:hypothetical protein